MLRIGKFAAEWRTKFGKAPRWQARDDEPSVDIVRTLCNAGYGCGVRVCVCDRRTLQFESHWARKQYWCGHLVCNSAYWMDLLGSTV